MKKISLTLACFLHLGIGGCIDYVRVEDEEMASEVYSFPPIIDAKGISPHPSMLTSAISVGKNCKGQTFKVPPIEDRNQQDRLYYLWFLDNELLLPRASIEPQFRASGIITLTIDEQFLLSHFETKLPQGFFNRPHLIQFFVSDLAYTIPESRYVDEKYKEKEHGDYVYWIVTFSDEPC